MRKNHVFKFLEEFSKFLMPYWAFSVQFSNVFFNKIEQLFAIPKLDYLVRFLHAIQSAIRMLFITKPVCKTSKFYFLN